MDQTLRENRAARLAAEERAMELVEGLRKVLMAPADGRDIHSLFVSRQTAAQYNHVPVDIYEQWSLEQEEMGNI